MHNMRAKEQLLQYVAVKWKSI